MDQFSDALKGYEIDIDQPIINTGEGFSYYEHTVGNYAALFGKFHTVYKDKDGKRCEKDHPGAEKQNYGMQDFLIIGSPDNHGFGQNFVMPANASYGEFIFKSYITTVPDELWRIKPLFEALKFAGFPQYDVIEKTGVKDSEFKVNFKNLAYFFGCRVAFTLNKGKKMTYITDLKLIDTTLTPELFKQRIAVINDLYTKLEALREREERERKERKEQNSETPTAPTTSAVDPSALMAESGFDNASAYE